ncbi:MAG: ABC transporter permease [candidate division NC10 bacterium]
MWRSETIKLLAFTQKSWINSRRHIFTVFEILFWPIVSVISVGLLTRFIALSAEMTAFVLVGTMALSIMQVCQLDVAYALLFEMWAKSTKHQFLAPVSPWHMVLGSWFMGVARGSVVFVLLAGLTLWAFDFNFFAPGVVPVAAFLLGLYLTAMLVGVLVSILLLLFGLRAEVSAWSTVSVVLLVCGIYYPVAVLPAPLAHLAAWIPLTYFLDAFRVHFGFAPEFRLSLAKGFLLSALYLVLAYWALSLAITRSRRTGVLLKLSE